MILFKKKKKKAKENAPFICANVRIQSRLLFLLQSIKSSLMIEGGLVCFYKHNGKLKMRILKSNLP
jgi:hypothetical protein